MTHAVLSPSSAQRWLTCPASVPLTANMPDEESDYALEGTLAHAWAEALLKGTATADGAPPFSAEEMQTIKAKKYDLDDMRTNVDFYADLVRNLGGDLFVEYHLDIESITGEKGAEGTSDAVVIKDTTLYVVDLKYGREKVEAVDNPQLAIYARAALNSFFCIQELTDVHMIIVQPRLNSVSEWSLTAEQLIDLTDGFGDKAKVCLNLLKRKSIKPELYQPSAKGCRWCKARTTCRALAKFALTAAGIDMLQARGPLLDKAELGLCLDKLDLIEQWASGLKEAALSMLVSGEEIPGWKAIIGREGNRKWGDEAAAEASLIEFKVADDDLYTKKLISPAQAAKLIKKKKLTQEQFDKLSIIREPGKPTLVPEADPRPSFREMSAADYPDETVKTEQTDKSEQIVKTEN